jgi:hypothetical protein
LTRTAAETIANRASVPGSGVLCGRTIEAGWLPEVSGVLARRTVGLTWTGGKAEAAAIGVGAIGAAVAAVSDERGVATPTAAPSWLVVEPERPRALAAMGAF